ncbi:hypothetical protein [Pseudomonas sp. PD9R]|uniref:hypothetical protein n=1 Tax=Pseudomonas sp. PD9R TaxID=2853534 RepID=UPI001C4459E1|nr:hypothetical protein [Pseudomonas sp. PD9R]MBV6826057.1 hypothetical protein [Pseudomonas sp. PD9R]
MSEVQSVLYAEDRSAPVIARLSRLEVRFEVPGIDAKRVYANGRMQVRVWVFVEAVDENGENVPLSYFPDLITTRLIRYHDAVPLEQEAYQGKPLAGWNSDRFENKYRHEIPGSVHSSGPSGGVTGEPLQFWVTSSVEGQMQIAAEVTLQGKVYRSNHTTNPDGNKINKSVIVHAERNPVYSIEQFNWQKEELEGNFDGDRLFRYHLGFYPGGMQVALLDWTSTQYGADGYPVKFCDTGLILGSTGPRSFVGVLAPVSYKMMDVYVSRHRPIAVNQRSGELTVVKGIPSVYVHTGDVRVAPFLFAVCDEYGTEHRLSLIVDIPDTNFVLQRG